MPWCTGMHASLAIAAAVLGAASLVIYRAGALR
jgi:hypothetical protein